MAVWDWLNEPFLKGGHLLLTPLALAKLVVLPFLLHFAAKQVGKWITLRGVHGSIDRGVAYAVGKSAYYSLMVVGLWAILAEAGVNLMSLAAFAGAVGVGIGLGLQSIAKNFLSGLILMYGRAIRPGDRIELQGVKGDVQTIGLNSTLIRTWDEAEVVVPNSMLLEQPVTNWTLREPKRLIPLDLSVSYAADASRVKAILEEVAMGTAGVLADPAPSARLVRLSESAVVFTLYVWTSDFVTAPTKLISALNLAVLERFAQEGLGLQHVP